MMKRTATVKIDLDKCEVSFAKKVVKLFKQVAYKPKHSTYVCKVGNHYGDTQANQIAKKVLYKYIYLGTHNPDPTIREFTRLSLHNPDFDGDYFNLFTKNETIGILENDSIRCINDGDFYNNLLDAKKLYKISRKGSDKYYDICYDGYLINGIDYVNPITMPLVFDIFSELGKVERTPYHLNKQADRILCTINM